MNDITSKYTDALTVTIGLCISDFIKRNQGKYENVDIMAALDEVGMRVEDAISETLAELLTIEKNLKNLEMIFDII